MQQASDRQFGGIIVFILVGVILAALLGGAIFASKQQGRIASRTDTVATNDQKTEDTATETPQNDTVKDDDSNEAQPATTSPQPQSTAPGGGSDTSVPSTGPTHIASTGLEDAFSPAIGLALVAAGVVSYRRSHIAVRARALSQ